MFRSRSIVLALAVLLALTCAASARAQIYVDANATGDNDGSSWTDAYSDLQGALNNSASGDEIWIAEGTYTPGTNRGDSFTLTGAKDGIEIYGGFESGDSFSDRNPADHPVVLSGDIGTTGDDSDNSYHVLYVDGTTGGNVTSATVLDGVTVTGGNANDSVFPNSVGGGLICRGAGSACSPTITGVIFSGNNAGNSGGAIFNHGATGGESSPTITNAVFANNSAENEGGAIYNDGVGGESSPTITNTLFSGNSANNGGAIYNSGPSGGTSSPTITNVTFTGNAANTQDGGAMYNDGSGTAGTSEPTITNAILWNDSAGGSGDEVFNNSATPTLSHTLVQGGCPSGSTCSNLLTADPLFVDTGDPDGPDGAFATDDDGLRLQAGSPAVDAGDDGAISLTEDITGAPRTQDGDGDDAATVDLGPYERPAATIYVDADATGAGDGTSWAHAYTDLQTALGNAASTSELWVAEGVYTPDPDGTNETVSFTITGGKDGLEIYGGFEGNESNRDERAPKQHVTVLSGDVDNNDTTNGDGITEEASDISGANSDHVLFLDGTSGGTITNSTIIDGVTVTAGQADEDFGGGLYCLGENSGNECSPALSGIVFAGNSAGGMFGDGGAIYNSGSGNGTASPTITNATFSGNSAGLRGGAIYNSGFTGGTASPTITNATFSGNSAGSRGGAIHNNGHSGTASPTITNATFSGNSADNEGGAIYNDGPQDGAASPQITNTILWGNTADDEGDEIFNHNGSATLSHSIIEGGVNGSGVGGNTDNTDDGGNLDQDPQFVDTGDPSGSDDTFATADDGVNVTPASPAVDAGDNSAVPAGITKDITGADRVQDRDGDGTATVNMGAYEVTSTVSPIATTSSAQDVGGTSANLTGTVNPGGKPATVQAQFFPTSVPSDVQAVTASASPLTGTTEQSVTISLMGLAPNTEYKARVQANNTKGGDQGRYVTFTTDAGYARRIKGTDGTGNDAGWRMLALPAAGKDRSVLEDDLTFATNSGSILYRWTAGSWTAQTSSSDHLPRGRGFMLYFFDDVIDPIESGGLPLAISTGPEDQSQDEQVTGLRVGDTFHLLGNPFDVAFDLSALNLSAQGFQQTVQIWDPSAGSYTQVTQSADDSDVIGAWQGLFVERAPNASTDGTTLTFSTAGKQGGSGDLIGSQSTSAAVAGAKDRAEKRLRLDLHLTVTDSASGGDAEPPLPQATATSAAPTREAPDSTSAAASKVGAETDTIATGQVGILLSEEATEGWDAYEASRLGPPGGSEAAVAFGSPLRRSDASALVQRALASEPYPGEASAATVPISVQAHSAAGRAMIRLPEDQRKHLPEEWAARLTDAETGEQVNLLKEGYSFELETGEGTDLQSPAASRFRLAVGPEGALPVAADGLTLKAPYPNPADQRATVEYVIPQDRAEGARLQLYDVLGRRVRTVPVKGGSHTQQLDVSGLASGVYILRLRTEGVQQTRKLTVVR